MERILKVCRWHKVPYQERCPQCISDAETHPIQTATQNSRGDWVKAIPEPYYGLRKTCYYTDNTPDHPSLWHCEEKFWTLEGYRAHYALKHILHL
jgi:hypothetical protein